MGVQDRDWYREETRRKEKLHYNPKIFRRSKSSTSTASPAFGRAPGAVRKILFVCVAVVCLVLFVSQWRRYDAAARQMAEASGREQKLRLQAAEQERIAVVEQQARLSRLRQDEANRLAAVAAQREEGTRARALATDDERRRRGLWEKFYKPDPGCERSASVECANAFIRARRRFDDLYPYVK